MLLVAGLVLCVGARPSAALGARAADLVPQPIAAALPAVFLQTVQGEADERHAFAREGEAYVATHPESDLRVVGLGSRITLTDRHGGREVSFALSRINDRPVTRPESSADGARLELRRHALTEWYLHGPLGLEQGFTLAQPPPGGSDRVTLDLAVEAPGYSVTSGADGSVELALGDRSIIVRDVYSYDATGRPLPSRMTWERGSLRLDVETRGARYPIVIDPTWSQQQKLTASDGGTNHLFGHSVSISGNTALVGAYQAGPGGAAYVFVRSGTGWTLQQRLVAPDGASSDRFGWSVALAGDTALVSAPQDDDGGLESGSAYVFVRAGSTWTLQQKLTAADGAGGDNFGFAVSLSGDTALVGAWNDDEGASANSGSAYVFLRGGTTWTQQQKLTASDAAAGAWFGMRVSVSGNTALVGAPFSDGPAVDCGAAYVFVRTGTTWVQEQRLTAADAAASDQFGSAVSLAGNTAAVGAPNDDDAGGNSGSAYVFVRSGSAWAQQQKLVASDAAPDDRFGGALFLSGDTVMVGAVRDDDAGFTSGSVYVFGRTGSAWSQEQKLTAADGAEGDEFGTSISMSGDDAIVGASLDDGAATNTGSAYVFVRGTTLCGNGTVDAGEVCDGGACCTSTCSFAPTTRICRTAGSSCDLAESCTGSSASCPPDATRPIGTPCGSPPSGPCDLQDTCAGSSGATAVCVPNVQPAALVCRMAVSGCDVEERCDGIGTACPTDAAAPAGTPCGSPVMGLCDAVDTCSGATGSAAVCVVIVQPSGHVCRPAVSSCDLADQCDGAATACPADALVDCDDGDACTADACESDGSCSHAPRDCDDGDRCTADSCGPDGACAHAPVAGCTDDAGQPLDASGLVDAGTAVTADADVSVADALSAADGAPSGADAGTTPPATSGCGCAVPTRRATTSMLLLVAASVLALLLARRGRSRRAPGAPDRRRGPGNE